MRVEVINTGTELLLGHVLNTHLRDLSEMLFPLGLRVERQTTVPDGPAIREAMIESFTRAELVLVTGGLGPTTDDITREIAAELLGLTLVHDEAVMEAIAKRFARRGLELTERVGKQALRPPEATVLANQFGTAPGLYFPAGLPKAGNPHLFLLPGPPRELIPMVRDTVLPILKSLRPPSELQMRSWRVIGLGESAVEKLVGEQLVALGAELGYCARPGEVDVRVIGKEADLVAAEKIVREKLGLHIAAHEERPLEAVVVDLLRQREETVATVESCTGGLLANRITNVPGASEVFCQGFVTYSNEAKTRAVKVDPALLEKHGAVSHQVAVAMALGAMAEADATYALATTGIAGPGGGSEEKPVGTVYIALAERGERPVVQRHQFPTDRATFKDLVTQTALDLLRLRMLARTA